MYIKGEALLLILPQLISKYNFLYLIASSEHKKWRKICVFVPKLLSGVICGLLEYNCNFFNCSGSKRGFENPFNPTSIKTVKIRWHWSNGCKQLGYFNLKGEIRARCTYYKVEKPSSFRFINSRARPPRQKNPKRGNHDVPFVLFIKSVNIFRLPIFLK